jgi:hypothetical protein
MIDSHNVTFLRNWHENCAAMSHEVALAEHEGQKSGKHSAARRSCAPSSVHLLHRMVCRDVPTDHRTAARAA